NKSGLKPAYPFEDLFAVLIDRAEALAWCDLDASTLSKFDNGAYVSLRAILLATLCELCAPALYERFAKIRSAEANPDAERPAQTDGGTARSRQFIVAMRTGGLRLLFDDKPVLLRLIAILTRQWIDGTREFISRLVADLPAIRRDLIPDSPADKVVEVGGGLSDPHNDLPSRLITPL